MDIPIENQRLRQIREENGLTQVEMAKMIDAGNSTADIERGKTRLLGKSVMALLKQYSINPLWLYGESERKYLNTTPIDIMPKTIVLDAQDHENILMVPAKASAGYGHNISDEKYLQTLPAFSFPLPEYRNATFRGFQISGDSMIPLVYNGDWVLAKAVSDIKEIQDDHIYVVVETDSIRLKKIFKLKGGEQLELVSLNPEYANTTTIASNVLEMWEYHSKISFGVERIKGLSLQSLQQDLQEIKNKLQ